MKNMECVPQRISKFLLGSIIMLAAAGLIVLGITLLPVFGFVLALPVVALAIYIYQLDLNDRCEIDLTS